MSHLVIIKRASGPTLAFVLMLFFGFWTINSLEVHHIGGQLAQIGSAGPTTYYVSPSGDDTNPGTIDQPWKTIERAFDARKGTYIVGGDTLYLRDGNYRFDSGVFTDNQNTWTNRKLISGTSNSRTTIAGYSGERPTIYLSDHVTGWQPYTARSGASIWMFDWRSYVASNHPSIYSRSASITNSSHQWYSVPEIVAIDSNNPTLLQEVNSSKNASSAWMTLPDGSLELEIKSVRTNQDDMIAGDFYYESDSSSPNYGKLFVWMPDGSDPNNAPLEVGLSNYFLLDNTLQEYITISNATFRYGNRGGISANGNRFLIDDVDSSYNGMSGVGSGICNSCTIVDSVLSYNGNSGATLGGDRITVEGTLFEGNNYREYAARWHCGGIKVTGGSDMTFRDNIFKDTVDCPGLWFDTAGTGHLVENNVFSGPPGSGRVLMFEITSGTEQKPNIIRNNIFKFTQGIFVSGSNYVYTLNNLFYEDGGVTMHGLGAGNRSSVSNNKFLNNIIYMRKYPANANTESVFIVQDAPAPYSANNNVSDYNIFFPSPDNRLIFGGTMSWGGAIPLTEWRAKGYDVHSKVEDPQLTNPAGGNYTPKAGSPVIGAGIVTPYVEEDMRGTSRGARNDMGPYQAPQDAVVPDPDPGADPQIPDLAFLSIQATPSSTGVKITWTTNIAATGQIKYGQTTSYGGMSSLDANLAPTHTQTLSGLSKNTTYHYQVVSKTSTGTTTISTDKTFKTTDTPVVQPTYTLTINKSGNGTGTVTGPGIDCGSKCSRTVDTGTSISLKAQPSSGSTFSGWSGGGCTALACSMDLSSNKTITAIFAKIAVLSPSNTNIPTPAYVAPLTYTPEAPLSWDIFDEPSVTVVEPVKEKPIPTRIIRNLRLGDSGPDVVLLQETLSELGYAITLKDLPSTEFDEETQLALVEYQNNQGGIDPSGIADNGTLLLLNKDIKLLEASQPVVDSADDASEFIPYTKSFWEIFIERIVDGFKKSVEDVKGIL